MSVRPPDRHSSHPMKLDPVWPLHSDEGLWGLTWMNSDSPSTWSEHEHLTDPQINPDLFWIGHVCVPLVQTNPSSFSPRLDCCGTEISPGTHITKPCMLTHTHPWWLRGPIKHHFLFTMSSNHRVPYQWHLTSYFTQSSHPRVQKKTTF